MEYEWVVVWIQFGYRIWMACCLNPICLWNMNGLLFECNLFLEYEWVVVWIQFVYRIWMVCYLNPICLWNMNAQLRGVRPLLSPSSTSAPWPTRYRTISRCSLLWCHSEVVSDYRYYQALSTCAPWPTRYRTTSRWPLFDAPWSGVWPPSLSSSLNLCSLTNETPNYTKMTIAWCIVKRRPTKTVTAYQSCAPWPTRILNYIKMASVRCPVERCLTTHYHSSSTCAPWPTRYWTTSRWPLQDATVKRCLAISITFIYQSSLMNEVLNNVQPAIKSCLI